MGGPLEEDLIDQIYECAFVPELWPSVLGRLGEIATARSSWMSVVSGDTSRFVGSNKAIEAAAIPLLKSGEVARSERLKRLVAARHPGFLREIDFYSPEELDADPLYQKYIFPIGLGYAAATLIATPTKDRLLVSLERERARGPVEPEAIRRLNSLRPHIARSLMTAARLRLERVEAAGAALAALGLPAVMLDGRGRALTANGLAETLVGTLRWKVRDQVAFADRAADRLLARGHRPSRHAGPPGRSNLSCPKRRDGFDTDRSFRAGAPVRAGRLLALRRRAHPHAGRGRARGAGRTPSVPVRSELLRNRGSPEAWPKASRSKRSPAARASAGTRRKSICGGSCRRRGAAARPNWQSLLGGLRPLGRSGAPAPQ